MTITTDRQELTPTGGDAADTGARDVEVVIIGSGFAGLGMAVRLLRDGVRDFVVLERGDEVGGTWRDNTYPGAACDVPSQLYSFSFDLNPTWSRSFSGQPEIFAYLRDVADRYGVRPHLRLRHTVTGARWDDSLGCWIVTTDQGVWRARFLVTGVGALSDPAIPEVPGLEQFPGRVFHSAQWDHDYDLTGKRVAVVGTGASAIQFVPQIQPQVSQLVLFQRTPPWVLPRRDRALKSVEHVTYRFLPPVQRFVRSAIYWGRESFAIALTRSARLLKAAEKIARKHIADQVPDPQLRAKVTPSYVIGCKRILIANDYYPALTQPNVEVVAAGLTRVDGRTVIGSDGSEHEVDAIIFGTGFHVTDMPMASWLHGRDGRSLAEIWRGTGMRAHRGTTVPGFPNLFVLVGPNTGLGHTSQVFMIEQQIGYVARALAETHRRGARTIEVRASVVAEEDAQLQQRMARTVWMTGGCASWYLDEHGRNSTLWPDFTFRFRNLLRRFDPTAYVFTERPQTQTPPMTSPPMSPSKQEVPA
jgi:cation diffusion facilitator CzcD-associated flavoprotein CzcO